MIAALVTDMIFRSRITATARAAQTSVRTLGQLDELAGLLAQGDMTLLIVDMDVPGAVAAIGQAAQAVHRPRVVAYFSHVQTELARQAKEAGADAVLPRSVFVQRLSELLMAPGPESAGSSTGEHG